MKKMASNAIDLEWHGEALVVVVNGAVESLRWDVVEQAADIILDPLDDQKAPMVIFDLTDVSYFGSVFLALLVRCHKLVRTQSGVMALCGMNNEARELLHITSLDTLWPVYDSRADALSSIGA